MTQRGISLQDCLTSSRRKNNWERMTLVLPTMQESTSRQRRSSTYGVVPDVLVVHLKRFSNSRALRDKIEAFVDFPIEGLDLSEMVQECKIAKHLQEQGVDVAHHRFGDY